MIDQNNPDGTFDEHKSVLGCVSEEEAKTLYLANYEDGWTGYGGCKAMTIGAFKEWVHGSRTGSRAEEQQLTYARRPSDDDECKRLTAMLEKVLDGE